MKEKLGISFKLEKRPYSAPMKARPVAIRQERHDPQVQPPSQNSGPQGALGPALELLRSVTEITSRSQPIQKDEPITQEEVRQCILERYLSVYPSIHNLPWSETAAEKRDGQAKDEG
eukprot:TRINITY_DN665_c0_g1_i2.p2 TRINITY_DN665_c0_g1~~TRINITY_DN665_c0_g1_i2.p2  ORF type:complete len:129 (-),score=20.01 TRINITY_DN665_c0_g1_i2:668-1018(-)